MIKECKVLINNDAVTVFKYGDAEVQVPSIGRDAKTVKVVVDKGTYKVVDDDYKEPVKVEKPKQEKQVKKAIAKEEVEEEQEEAETADK